LRRRSPATDERRVQRWDVVKAQAAECGISAISIIVLGLIDAARKRPTPREPGIPK